MTASTTNWSLIVLGTLLLTGICLWGLFRPGSIAHRARSDDEHPDVGPRASQDQDSGSDPAS